MAWNRSVDSEQEKVKISAKRSSLSRGIIAAGIVIVGASVVWLVLSPTSEKNDSKIQTPAKQIKEVAPARPSAPKPHDSEKPPQKAKSVVDHPATNKWGNPWHWGPNMKLRAAHTTRVDRASLPISYTAFEHIADRDIAGLLTIEPGTSIIAAVEYDQNFVESFLESLKSPALVSERDSEEVKALKRIVNETKAELKARYDAGEDIAKIMNETRQELVQLGAYREELRALIAEKERDDSVTSEDMEDVVNAANRMLEERGLKKIVMPEFYYKKIELRNQKRKAKELNEK